MALTGFSVLTSSLSLTSYVVVSLLIVYIAKNMRFVERNIVPWLFLAVGVLIVSVNHAVRILTDLGYDVSGMLFLTEQNLALLGSTLVFIGFGLVVTERMIENAALERRHEEIKKIMDKLKEKYMRRELDEGDLKKIYPRLVEKLAEIEVKMGEK